MEPTRPNLGQQKPSFFNPEATAFDPDRTPQSNQDTARSPFEHAVPSNTMNKATNQPPQMIVHPKISGLKFSAIDISELNNSLGLSSPNLPPDVLPTHSQTSRAVPSLPEAYGNLIGRALDKPLTADELAGYLKSNATVSSNETTAAPGFSLGITTSSNLPGQEIGYGSKLLWPPPGLGHHNPRETLDEDAFLGLAFTLQSRHIPTGPRASSIPQNIYQYEATNPVRQCTNPPLSRRRQRAIARTKRLDQGPEPSVADIYPDDANWVPSHRPFDARDRLDIRPSLAPQISAPRDLQVENDIDWPTPAEVSHRAIVGEPPISKPLVSFNLFENHVPPTAADMNAFDADVIFVVDNISTEMMNTWFDLEPMSSESGQALKPLLRVNKYGLEFYGVGLGDSWNPPKPTHSEGTQW